MEQVSYWERKAFLSGIGDLVVGAGIVGLTAAIELKRLYPDRRVVVFDRSPFGAGGSTKNAGFACFGSPSELLSDLENMPESEVKALVKMRWDGLQVLRDLLGDQALAYAPCGSVELFLEAHRSSYQQCVDALPRLNRLTTELCGRPAYRMLEAETLASRFPFSGFIGGIENTLEGSIDTGKMMRNLRQLASDSGVEIFGGVDVNLILDKSNQYSLNFKSVNISYERLFICTNGFAKQLLPELDVHPARNLVLLTEAIPELPFSGTFHMEEGFVYFRTVDQRILIGGGRHLDTDWKSSKPVPEHVKDYLLNLLHSHIFPQKLVRIEQEWTGILGVGATRRIIQKQLAPNVFCAVRMGGMGVAIGSAVGQSLARMANEV